MEYHSNPYSDSYIFLSSKKNSLVTIYDISRDDNGIVQLHAPPFMAHPGEGPFSSTEWRAGIQIVPSFKVDDNTFSLLELSSRGAVFEGNYKVARRPSQGNGANTSSDTTGLRVDKSPAYKKLEQDPLIYDPAIGPLEAARHIVVDLSDACKRKSSKLSTLLH